MTVLRGATRWKWILQASRSFLNRSGIKSSRKKLKKWNFKISKKKSKKLTTIFGGSGGEIYTVFDEESESEVENLEILHPDLELKENSDKKKKEQKTRRKSVFPFISAISPFFLGGGECITGGSG